MCHWLLNSADFKIKHLLQAKNDIGKIFHKIILLII